MATEREELKQLADECYTEATNFMREGKHKAALETALRAKGIYTDIDDKRQLALVTNVISLIYEEIGESALELQFQLDALEIAIDTDAYDVAAKLYNNLGSKLLFSKDYNRALQYLQHAVEMGQKAEEANLFTEDSRHSYTLVINMNLSTTYYNLGNAAEAKRCFEIAKKESTQITSEDLLYSYLVFEALYYKRTGELDKAKALIAPIMAEVENNPYTTDYLEVLLDVIELLKEIGDFTRWEEVLTHMDEHLDDASSVFLKLEILNQWLIFYRASGRIEEYKETCEKYYELSTEKAKQDALREANTIEINAEMRQAMRQKKMADSMIYTDSLTGIGNRNKMLEDSKQLIEDSYRNNTNIAIGLLDIDFFKECNDTYGHIEGDRCLKSVAQVIKEAVGDNGNVYRYGGDEFLILMDHGSVALINEIGETIKKDVDALRLPNRKSPICSHVTISQGYTSAIAEENDTIDTLVKTVDRVLYSVKRCGRNDFKYMTLSQIKADCD